MASLAKDADPPPKVLVAKGHLGGGGGRAEGGEG